MALLLSILGFWKTGPDYSQVGFSMGLKGFLANRGEDGFLQRK
jgi:hypothetical protein